jgi:OOP family OmpA-OmpF porin
MRKYSIAALAALGLTAVPAHAADSGFYVGAGIGYGSVDTDSIEVVTDEFFNLDDSATAWKIFGGWRLNQYVGFELDYLDLGTLSSDGTYTFDVIPTPTATTDVYAKADLSFSGWAPYVVGTFPIGVFEVSAKLGYVFYDYDIDLYATDGIEELRDSTSDSDQDFAWGLGAAVTLFDHLNVKVEYEAIEVSDANVDAWWLTGAWRF